MKLTELLMYGDIATALISESRMKMPIKQFVLDFPSRNNWTWVESCFVVKTFQKR